MRTSYNLATQDEEGKALTEKLMTAILDSGVTYKTASLALETTLVELEERTRPVRAEIPEITGS